MYTVKKKPSVTQDQDTKIPHPRRTIGKIRQHQRLGLSFYAGDGISGQTWLF
jgi:hypothetical protein